MFILIIFSYLRELSALKESIVSVLKKNSWNKFVRIGFKKKWTERQGTNAYSCCLMFKSWK